MVASADPYYYKAYLRVDTTEMGAGLKPVPGFVFSELTFEG